MTQPFEWCCIENYKIAYNIDEYAKAYYNKDKGTTDKRFAELNR